MSLGEKRSACSRPVPLRFVMSPSKAISPHVQLALAIIVVLGLCLLIDILIPLGTG